MGNFARALHHLDMKDVKRRHLKELAERKIKEELRSFEIEGRQIPLILRRHPYAQRMILRLNIDGDGAVITIPMNASSADAFDLVRRKSHWLYPANE